MPLHFSRVTHYWCFCASLRKTALQQLQAGRRQISDSHLSKYIHPLFYSWEALRIFFSIPLGWTFRQWHPWRVDDQGSTTKASRHAWTSLKRHTRFKTRQSSTKILRDSNRILLLPESIFIDKQNKLSFIARHKNIESAIPLAYDLRGRVIHSIVAKLNYAEKPFKVTIYRSKRGTNKCC